MNTNLHLPKGPFARLNARGCRVVGLAVIAATTTPSLIRAQETAAPPSRDQGATSLETVVVTGSAISGGVRKLEASYNIVTANEEQIRQVESQEHGGSAEDLAGPVAGIDRRSDRRQHRNRGLSRRRRRAVFHDAADGFAAVRHADAVVLRNHEHLSGSTTPSERWKSCKADRQSYLPAARWAPPQISFSRRAPKSRRAVSA